VTLFNQQTVHGIKGLDGIEILQETFMSYTSAVQWYLLTGLDALLNSFRSGAAEKPNKARTREMKIPSSVLSKGFPNWLEVPPRMLIPSFSPGPL